MGVDMHVYIYEKSKENGNKWKPVKLYREYEKIDGSEKTYTLHVSNTKEKKMVKIEPYWGRNYDLFKILSGDTDGFSCWSDVDWEGFLNLTEAEAKKEMWYDEGGYGWKEVNLADFKNYINDLEKPYKEETLSLVNFYNDIANYIKIANWDSPFWDGKWSNYKIVYFFDC